MGDAETIAARKKQLEESVELRALLSGEVTDKGLLIKSKETELREMREELRTLKEKLSIAEAESAGLKEQIAAMEAGGGEAE